MSKKSAYLDRLAAIPMFSACSQAELRHIAQRTTEITVKAGHVLAHEGRVGYELFVIVSGEAEVSRLGQVVAKLGPGDFFGELALLDRAPRDATVTARTQMSVVVLARQELEAALAEAPNMTMKLLRGMARRLRQLDVSSPSQARAQGAGLLSA